MGGRQKTFIELVLGFLVLVLLCSTPKAARADSEEGRFHSPFLTMDRMDGSTNMGMAAGYMLTDMPGTWMAFNLYFNSMSAEGPGFYGSLPMGHVSIDEDGSESFSEVGVGSPEIGVVFPMNEKENSIGFLRIGGVLGFAEFDGDNILGFAPSTVVRQTDIVSAPLETFWIRASYSFIHESDQMMIRVDAGLDIPISHPETVDPNKVLRFNFALAQRLDEAIVGIEFTNIKFLDSDTSDSLRKQIALSVRFESSNDFEPGFSYIIAFDNEEFADGALLFDLRFR